MIDQSFYKTNRISLASSVNSGLVVVAGQGSVQRSNDTAYPFEQDASFWYLSGIREPNWVLIIDGSSSTSWLIAPDVDEVHRIFDGLLSHEKAQETSGVDYVIDATEGDKLLRSLAKKHSVVHTIGTQPHAEHYDFVLNPAQKNNWRKLERIFNQVEDCRSDITKLRAIKQPQEIMAIKRAVKLTTDSFSKVKSSISDFKYEYEVEAEFDYTFKKKNANHAYDPIVAGGENAVTLHYIKNNQKLRKKSLLLVDIGARVDGYAADITRTFAVGEPTTRQRDVHAAVESAHHEIISLINPLLSVEEYQRRVDDIMVEALKKLDLYTDESSLRRYFPHAVSHGLGIDVHDSLGSPKYFQENMTLTVEPGIYIPEEGIGVRIEDDILVTRNGHENLSASLSTGL